MALRWESIERLLAPQAVLGPDERAVFDAERTLHNPRLMRVVGPVTCVVLVVVELLARRTASRTNLTANEAAYVGGVLAINHLGALLATILTIVAWQRAGTRLSRLQRDLGDAAVVTYVLSAALISANAQRVTPTLQMFLFTALASALFRPRAAVQIGALVVGLLVVLGGLLAFQPESFFRTIVLAPGVLFAAIATAALVSFERVRVRELSARLGLGRLNAELGQRVDAQVHEIVARAREIDGLNARLAEKVRERSRELSVVLARLAEGQDAHPSIAPGTVLGDRVVVEGPLGAGGMGVVYRGFDRIAKAPVAVKLVQASSAAELDGLHRFLREARSMASVDHPAVVRSLHVDVSDDGRLFQILRARRGRDARGAHAGRQPDLVAPRGPSRLRSGRRARRGARRRGRPLHVKPANVMLTRAAPGLKLLDFGVSRLRDVHDSDAPRSRDDAIVGTPQYMAPEQFADRRSVSDRTDVYALGLVVYQCVTRRLPHEAKSLLQWLAAHTSKAPVDLRAWASETDATVADLVMSCLSKDPTTRPSATEVAEALRSLADRPSAPPLEQVAWPSMAPVPSAALAETLARG